MTTSTFPGRPAPSGPSPGIIVRVGHHPDGLRNGKGPARLPGDPTPFRKSHVGSQSGQTAGNLNQSLNSACKGKVRDDSVRQD
jgi:hypothetical protein